MRVKISHSRNSIRLSFQSTAQGSILTAIPVSAALSLQKEIGKCLENLQRSADYTSYLEIGGTLLHTTNTENASDNPDMIWPR